MTTRTTESPGHCAYCGHTLGDEAISERFGDRFCSEAHAEEFVAGVRTARVEAAARSETAGASNAISRGACWIAPLLLILAVPLIWSGGWAATGGSLLSVLALLACPLGMYFMMRGMSNMQRHDRPTEAERAKQDRHV